MVRKYAHVQMIPMLSVLLASFLVMVPTSSNSEPSNSVDVTIQHLLGYVARSDLTFIRNTQQYTASEASEHMRKKYVYFKEKITTAEAFIQLCAMQSMLTGIPYQVINKRGEKVKTSEWLTTELENYRNRTTGDAD